MSEITPRSNDPANYEKRLRKTITNKKAAEYAMEFAEGKELESIKEKNARRDKSIKNLMNDKND